MQNFSPQEYPLSEYNSETLQLYLEFLSRYSEVQLLDLGPVCKENIVFFAERAKKLTVCDMFYRLDRHRRRGLSIEKVWNHLDYGPDSFNGIHLWDLLDHIDNGEAERLAALCHNMLKPNGILFIISLDEHLVSGRINAFVIQDKRRLALRVQPHLSLPWCNRNIGTLTSLLSKFSFVKSYLSRDGVRELLFSRE